MVQARPRGGVFVRMLNNMIPNRQPSADPNKIVVRVDTELLQKLRDGLEKACSSRKLTPEEAESGSVDPHFICKACTKVTDEPVECTSCKNLTCGDCSAHPCKTCQQTSFGDANDFVLRSLKQLQFKCARCKNPNAFSYEKRSEHFLQGCVLGFKCPFQSCARRVPFIKPQQMMMHWQKDCPDMAVVCLKCKQKFQRKSAPRHKCGAQGQAAPQGQPAAQAQPRPPAAQQPRPQVQPRPQAQPQPQAQAQPQPQAQPQAQAPQQPAAEPQEVSQEQAAQALAKQATQIANANPQLFLSDTDMRCKMGHPMMENDEPFPRMLANGNMDPGTNIDCDKCKKKINFVYGFFRCGNTCCDYDLCFNCGFMGN